MKNVTLLVISKKKERRHMVHEKGSVQQLNVSKEHFLIDLTLVHLTEKGGKVFLFGLFFYLYPNVNE